MTKAIGVAHDWDPGVVLYALHETVTPSWNDQINVLVESKKRRNFCPGLNCLDVGAWE